jgi:hypothetical protein
VHAGLEAGYRRRDHPDAEVTELLATALERVHRTAAVIRADREFPPTPGPRCSHCPWQPSCPEGRETSAD